MLSANASAPTPRSSVNSPMFRSCTVTASDSGLSRRPLHVGALGHDHVLLELLRTASLSVSE
jgi:hypothetical protein